MPPSPNYTGEIVPPMPMLAAFAGIGMGIVSWLHLSPQTMLASLPRLHSGCMAMYGGSTSVLAAIFYLAWLAHVAEACFAVRILAKNGWLRAGTAVPWFLLTFLFGYPQLGRLLRADKDRRRQKAVGKRI